MQPPKQIFADEQHYIRWNEAMAHKYDPEAYHLRSNFLIRWIERRRVKTILRFLKTQADDPVLEVGCGAGNVLGQIPSRRLTGIDLSATLLKKSQRRLAGQPAGLIQTNALQLAFAAGKFRKLVCTEVLEHVPDPAQVLREMARVATADALVVVSVPNEAWIDRVKGLIRRLGLAPWLLHGQAGGYHSPEQMTDEWHLHRFDRQLLAELAQGILLIRQLKAIPFAFLPLRYVACFEPVAARAPQPDSEA
jgi:2-polyprenyl-3-methyl-5-hydroxy-6-metoxy-1,4-benzoquinol methylase